MPPSPVPGGSQGDLAAGHMVSRGVLSPFLASVPAVLSAEQAPPWVTSLTAC
jgi:hypothetical protein